MPFRLLAIDIDGTLLNSERLLSDKNQRAIEKAVAAGIQVVLASGRIAASVRQFSDQLGLGPAMVCSNGAHVQGRKGEELLHINLGQAAVDASLEYAKVSSAHCSAYTRNELYFLSESPWGEVYRKRVRAVQPIRAAPEDVRCLPLLKLIFIDEPEAIAQHRFRLEQVLTPSIACLTESEPNYLEVLPPDANKGRGLEVLSRSLGISQHETAAIGDYFNDLEMVQWAGLGAAIGNAEDSVKEAADLVVPSNDESGVAAFIELLIERNASGA
jgi:Cof subfamily protein (haloacid dehalogenase superfamily)